MEKCRGNSLFSWMKLMACLETTIGEETKYLSTSLKIPNHPLFVFAMIVKMTRLLFSYFQVRSLANHCYDKKFQKPSKQQIAKRVL
jgi:hypothetical protein